MVLVEDVLGRTENSFTTGAIILCICLVVFYYFGSLVGYLIHRLEKTYTLPTESYFNKGGKLLILISVFGFLVYGLLAFFWLFLPSVKFWVWVGIEGLIIYGWLRLRRWRNHLFIEKD